MPEINDSSPMGRGKFYEHLDDSQTAKKLVVWELVLHYHRKYQFFSCEQVDTLHLWLFGFPDPNARPHHGNGGE